MNLLEFFKSRNIFFNVNLSQKKNNIEFVKFPLKHFFKCEFVTIFFYTRNIFLFEFQLLPFSLKFLKATPKNSPLCEYEISSFSKSNIHPITSPLLHSFPYIFLGNNVFLDPSYPYECISSPTPLP